jgi:hypothetical protein
LAAITRKRDVLHTRALDPPRRALATRIRVQEVREVGVLATRACFGGASVAQQREHAVKAIPPLRMHRPGYVLAVTAPPRDDVEVDVKDILLGLGTGAVDDLHIRDANHAPVEIHDALHGTNDRDKLRDGGVEDIHVVRLGDDQRVPLARREDVEKCVR